MWERTTKIIQKFFPAGDAPEGLADAIDAACNAVASDNWVHACRLAARMTKKLSGDFAVAIK